MKISILIPTMNPKHEYLQAAMRSIPNNVDEVVLALGHETVLDGYAFPPAKEIKLMSFGMGVGLTSTVNLSVAEQVTGDWFSILPDDDFYTEHIAQIVSVVRESDADFVHFPSLHFINNTPQPGLFDNVPGITFEQNLKLNQITGSAFIRKSAFEWLGGYQGKICMDWDIYNRALKSGMKFQFYPYPGIVFRFNDHSRLQRQSVNMGMGQVRELINANAKAWEKKIC